MTFNRVLTLCTSVGWLAIAGCDFDKTLGSVGEEESGTSGDGESGTTGDTACPADAMLCPDGTAVGRQGPNCEFAPCPGDDSTGGEGCPADTKTCPDGQVLVRQEPSCEFPTCGGCPGDAMVCPDGSYVGRDGPECEFAPCPDVEACDPEACGPAPGAPNGMCEDGTVSGPVCIRQPDLGTCGWEFRECDLPCPPEARLCPDGSTVGSSGPDCAFLPCPGECEREMCPGEPPPIANELCPDGTLSGPTCLQRDDGTCGWANVSCTYACDADAYVCPDGTTVGREGPDCEFAPCPTTCAEGWVEAEPSTCPSSDAPLLPGAGCYEPCQAVGDACSPGHVCMVVQTNPCVCQGDEVCCAACGSYETLCVPEGT